MLSFADLHPKKRKREEAGLDEKVKSTDVSLDEGEIPADIAAPKQQDAMSGNSTRAQHISCSSSLCITWCTNCFKLAG